jgi:hypothetical protein
MITLLGKEWWPYNLYGQKFGIWKSFEAISNPIEDSRSGYILDSKWWCKKLENPTKITTCVVEGVVQSISN